MYDKSWDFVVNRHNEMNRIINESTEQRIWDANWSKVIDKHKEMTTETNDIETESEDTFDIFRNLASVQWLALLGS